MKVVKRGRFDSVARLPQDPDAGIIFRIRNV
jgi:hypothetical protein